MFQKNLKLRTNIVVGTVPLQNYETPQKTVDVTEAFSFYPPCAMATEEYANDTPPLKNREREETAKPSLSCTYRRVTQYIYIYMYIYIYIYIQPLHVNYRYLRKLPVDDGFTLFSRVRECKYSWTARNSSTVLSTLSVVIKSFVKIPSELVFHTSDYQIGIVYTLNDQ